MLMFFSFMVNGNSEAWIDHIHDSLVEKQQLVQTLNTSFARGERKAVRRKRIMSSQTEVGLFVLFLHFYLLNQQ